MYDCSLNRRLHCTSMCGKNKSPTKKRRQNLVLAKEANLACVLCRGFAEVCISSLLLAISIYATCVTIQQYRKCYSHYMCKKIKNLSDVRRQLLSHDQRFCHHGRRSSETESCAMNCAVNMSKIAASSPDTSLETLVEAWFHDGKAMIKSRRLSLFYMIYGKIFHLFFSFWCTHWGIICPLIDPKWDLGTTCWDAVQLFEPIIKLQKRKTTAR